MFMLPFILAQAEYEYYSDRLFLAKTDKTLISIEVNFLKKKLESTNVFMHEESKVYCNRLSKANYPRSIDLLMFSIHNYPTGTQ